MQILKIGLPGNCNYKLALATLGLLLAVGCSSLPKVADITSTPASSQPAQPLQLDGAKGTLSVEQSKAVLKKISRRSPETNIFDWHLALEESIAPTRLVVGNKVVLFQDGPSTYQAMYKAIDLAKDHINMETYIIEDDEVGRNFARVLIDKQKAGVQVNLIYDSVGSINTPREFFSHLTENGINVLEFNPVNPLAAKKGWQINQRDHRKLLIIDGQVAFLGGINISAVYSGGSASRRSPPNGEEAKVPWRDTHMQIDGPVVANFQKLFIETWTKQKGATLAEKRYFPPLKEKGREVIRAIGSSSDEGTTQMYTTLISAINSAETAIYLTNAYFVPDLVLVLAAPAVWWRLARRWLPATIALVVAVVFILTHGELIGLTMIVPWNTLATQLTLLTGLWVMVAGTGPRTVVVLAGLAAVTWLVRPIDAVSFAPMLVWSGLRLPTWRQRLGWGAVGVGVLAVALVAVGVLNLRVFGVWRSPYEQAAFTMVGFFDYPVAQKLFWTFVDARPFFGETDTALLGRYPWLFLTLPGIFFWVKREGAAGAAAVATLLLNWLLYLGYNDFFPSSFYRFSLIHYISWSFLPLVAASAGACWAGWKMPAVRVGAGLALGAFFLAGGLQLEEHTLPVPVAEGEVSALPATRPLWVRFPGESLEQVTKLRLNSRAMTEAADYQIPYVPSDLKLLLGDHAKGIALTAPPETGIKAIPQVGDYHWAWRWDVARWHH